MLVGAGIGSLLGLVKHFAVDGPEEERKKKLAIAREMTSHVTGQHGQTPDHSSSLGSLMQGGLAGGQLAQGVETFNADQALRQKQGSLIDSLLKSSGADPQKIVATGAPMFGPQLPGPDYSSPIVGDMSFWDNMRRMSS
jgi:hypothetical protein